MTLAEKVATSPKVVGLNPPKILTLDIERVPGIAEMQHRGLTIRGDFWDLNSWKHIIGRRINPDEVSEWPRTICFAWRWYGSRRAPSFCAEWDEGGHDAMVRTAWEAYHQADIVVGHNVVAFDTKKLTWDWAQAGLGRPSPWKAVDTLTIARNVFGAESNTLASLTERLGITTKVDKYNVKMARDACAGDKKAQRRLATYNRGDIIASEELYDRVRGWIPGHPHIGLWSGEDKACGNCGCTDLVKHGWARTPLTVYAQYLCTNCGAWSRQKHRKGAVEMRTVR